MKKYRCTCPDYQEMAIKNPSASAPSELYTRNWSKNFDGVTSKNGICEHIFAVLRITKQLKAYGIPNDIPMPPLPEEGEVEEVPIGELDEW